MPDAPALTHHAQTRMRQRGLRDGDLRLVLHCGSQVADDAFILTDQDAEREIERLKRADSGGSRPPIPG